MADHKRQYLVMDPGRNCCVRNFYRRVEWVLDLVGIPFATIANAEAGYALIGDGRSVDFTAHGGVDPIWSIVEEKDFDESKLVKKDLSLKCDECLRMERESTRGW